MPSLLPDTLLAEIERQSRTRDNWYTEDRPYALELRGPEFDIVGGSEIFVLPLGPEQYTTQEQFRQSVRPTIGGIVAEEKGTLWRVVNITGSFGLFPKVAADTTTWPEEPMHGEALSGPGWFRRLERNVIGRYAQLKSDPKVAADVELVWHDTRKDDHWIVVPEMISLRRSTGRRIQYPYALQLKAIADTDAVDPARLKTAAQLALEDINPRNLRVVQQIRAGIEQVQAAMDYASEVQAQIRYVVADVATVTGDLVEVVRSAQAFVDGVADTISSPRQFIFQATTALQSMLDTLESASTIPMEVRQNYQSAADGLDAVVAVGVFGDTYQSRLSRILSAEQGSLRSSQARLDGAESDGPPKSVDGMVAQAVRSVDNALIEAGVTVSPRATGTYTGIRDHTLTATDTLEGLAASFLGDSSLWYDLVVVNDLTYPYLSPTGAPGTLAPGDAIAVPTTGSAPTPAVGKGRAQQAPMDDLMGVGIRLKETVSGSSGRPLVDLDIDKSTGTDVALLSGVPNLAQALQMRMWTERGSIPSAPSYGLRRLVGFGVVAADVTALRIAARETVLADSRVAQVQRLSLEVDTDLVDLSMDVVPIGSTSARTLRSNLN